MTKIILSALTGAVIVFFLMRGCGTSTTGVAQAQYDSLALASRKADTVYQQNTAALIVRINTTQAKADTIWKSIPVQLAKNDKTVSAYTAAKIVHDTVSAIIICDTMMNQNYPATVAIGMKYKHERDSLISALKVKDMICSEENARLGRVDVKKDSLNKAINAQFKQASKRWSIGIGAGYGIGKNGLTPVVNVGIQYNLLKIK